MEFDPDLISSEIKLLLYIESHYHSPSQKNSLLKFASENGYAIAVQQLLQDRCSNTAVVEGSALRSAVELGHVDVMQVLLSEECLDVAPVWEDAMKRALKRGREDVIETLLADNRVRVTIRREWRSTMLALLCLILMCLAILP